MLHSAEQIGPAALPLLLQCQVPGLPCWSRSSVGRLGLAGTIPAPAGWVLPDSVRELDVKGNVLQGKSLQS